MRITCGIITILIVFAVILITFAKEIKDSRKHKLLEKYGYEKVWRGGNDFVYKNQDAKDTIFPETAVNDLSVSELKSRLKRNANVHGDN